MTPKKSDDSQKRKEWLSVLAKSDAKRLCALAPAMPAHSVLRAPEIGTVMVRGRIGGTGAPFNLGEMTVTRCSVRLEDGTVGHGYVQGRDKSHATRAAVMDALLQTPQGDQLFRDVVAVLQDEARTAQSLRSAKAAATKVEFFTMVRGDD